MRRIAYRAFIAASVLALVLVGSSQGGPDDSEPIGPLPHAIIHVPSTISKTTTSLEVWVHAHNMLEQETWLCLNKNGAAVNPSISGYAVTQVGEASWDTQFIVNLSGLNLQNGDTLTWVGETLNFDDCTLHTASKDTAVTN